MSTRNRVETRIDDAARVARKILGDLQAIARHYKCIGDKYARELAHDIEKGLEHDCFESFEFCLFRKSDNKLIETYEYDVDEDGDFEPSLSSGRVSFDERLEHCRFDVWVNPSRDRKKWNELKSSNELKRSWSPSNSPDRSGMTMESDGGYSSGKISVGRKKYKVAS